MYNENPVLIQSFCVGGADSLHPVYGTVLTLVMISKCFLQHYNDETYLRILESNSLLN